MSYREASGAPELASDYLNRLANAPRIEIVGRNTVVENQINLPHKFFVERLWSSGRHFGMGAAVERELVLLSHSG
jgi:hypothetical protein